MSLIPAGTPAPSPAPSPTPAPAGGTPAPSPSEGGGGDDRPEWVPEALWKDGKFDEEGFTALSSRPEPQADVPGEPTGYVIPAIDGLDVEVAAASPLFQALMKGAHANKVGQAAFDAIVGDYVASETAKADAFEQEQRTALGPQADTRLKALGTWLDSSLDAEEAAAVRGTMTTAKGVEALEKLMNARVTTAPRDDPPPPVAKDTKEAIEAIMKTPAYRGKESERDPAVIKRVDDWFAANATPKKRP